MNGMNVEEAVKVWRQGNRVPLAAVGAVYRGLAGGMNAREIADALGVSFHSVASTIRSYGLTNPTSRGRPRKDRTTPQVDLWEDRPFSLVDIVSE